MKLIKNTNTQLIKKLPGYYPDLLTGASTAASSNVATNGTLSYYALLIPETLLIQEVVINQTSSNAGVSLKMNLYDSDPTTLLPRNKLLTDQTVTSDVAGIKVLAVGLSLKGLYYFAIARPGGGAPTIRTKANNTQAGTMFGLDLSTPLNSPILGTRLSTFTFADTLPSVATQDSPSITYLSSAIPMLWYKI